MIRKANKTDDLDHIAKLIFDTAKDVYTRIFKSEERALKYFRQLVALENNMYSHNNIHCCIEDDSIKGIIIVNNYSGSGKMDFKDFYKVMGFFTALYYGFRAYPELSFTTSEGKECYIDSICVDANSRGQGVGSKLLEFAFENARENEHEYIYLDVDIKNPRAKKLYESMGFEVHVKKTAKNNPQKGLYGMKKKL